MDSTKSVIIVTYHDTFRRANEIKREGMMGKKRENNIQKLQGRQKRDEGMGQSGSRDVWEMSPGFFFLSSLRCFHKYGSDYENKCSRLSDTYRRSQVPTMDSVTNSSWCGCENCQNFPWDPCAYFADIVWNIQSLPSSSHLRKKGHSYLNRSIDRHLHAMLEIF